MTLLNVLVKIISFPVNWIKLVVIPDKDSLIFIRNEE